MQITDPVADMLTRIRNANTAKHESVDVPASNLKKAIAKILLDEGYIKSFQIIDDGTQEDYKIVTTVRGNSLEGLISNESPLGKALLGKKVGDIVHVQVNASVGYDVEIKALKNTEDDGDKIRSF